MKYIKRKSAVKPNIQGSIVDTFNVEDKTTNAPSVNAVENYIKAQNTYSTEETFTGKYWINGKKIYRKVVEFTVPSTSSDGTLATGSKSFNNNIETIVNLTDGMFYADNNLHLSISQTTPPIAVYYMEQNKTLNFENSRRFYSGSPAFVIVEYTKTTD